MKCLTLAAVLAVAVSLACSGAASAQRVYYRPWYAGYPAYAAYPVATGGPYRMAPGPVPYSTILQPDPPTYVVPYGPAPYARPYVTAYPYWYY
jgi:hypothetical protein